MSSQFLANRGAAPIPDPVKKKRLLLVDASHAQRDLRAEVLRRRGIDVDSASDIAEARIWWRPALYDLVLIHMEKGSGQRDKFCDELRSAHPPQRLAFLVGRPAYLTDLPNEDQEVAMESGEERTAAGDGKRAFPADAGETMQRWGILEASRQISAVRSASIARAQAMRALPPPQRDSEVRPVKISKAIRENDFLKEEL